MLLRCSDSLRSLMSHFPDKLKLGIGSPSVGEAVGANAVSIAFLPGEPQVIRLTELAANSQQHAGA